MLDEDLDAIGVPAEAEETVNDIMTTDVHATSPDTPLPEIAAKMLRLRIHRILVREKHKYIGLINTFDMLGAMTPSTA